MSEKNEKIKSILLSALAPIMAIPLIAGIAFVFLSLPLASFSAGHAQHSIILLWCRLVSKIGSVLVLWLYCHRVYPFVWRREKIIPRGFLITVCISIILWLVDTLLIDGNLNGLRLMNGCTAYSLILLTLISVVASPIIEELLFRKWMFSYMGSSGLHPLLILLVTSVFFYLWHGDLSRWYLIFSGLIYGAIYMKTKNVSYPIIGHATFNLLCVLFGRA